MAQIARRADVASATVLNHFPNRDDLDQAIVERAFAEMRMPDVEIFEGIGSLTERIRILSRETGAFNDRGIPWYSMWQRDPMVTGAWASAGAQYGRRWEALVRAALGPLADDRDAAALLNAAMDWRFFEVLRQDGRTTEQAADLAAAGISPWLEARLATSVAGLLP